MSSNTPPRKKPIDLRILNHERALIKLCEEKGQPEKYVAPSVSLDCESARDRKDRRRDIRNSLMTEEEKRQMLEKKRIAQSVRDKRARESLNKNSAIIKRKRKPRQQKIITTTCQRCSLNRRYIPSEIYIGGLGKVLKGNSDDCKCKWVPKRCDGHYVRRHLVNGAYCNVYKCDVKEWSAPPYCKEISSTEKRKIEIVGQDGQLTFASGMTENAEYITEKLDESFLSTDVYSRFPDVLDASKGRILKSSHQHRVHYCKRDMDDAIKHMFSLTLDNLKANCMQYQCNIRNILECEIRINGIKFGTMMDCKHSAAELIPQSDDLLITHQFTFEHGKTPWGWHECFSLNLIYGPLPKDIKADFETNPQKLDNFSYTYITRRGISSIKFRDIHFRQSGMQSGFSENSMIPNDILYFIAWKSIYERKERRTITDLEAKHIMYRIEDERKKNKYWLCARGCWLCHTTEYLDFDWVSLRCSDICEKNRYKMFEVSKAKFTGCIDGHEICHDGIIQCPRCRESNKPRNRPLWKCKYCKKQYHDMNARQFEVHKSNCDAQYHPLRNPKPEKPRRASRPYWLCINSKCRKLIRGNYKDCQKHENACLGFDFHNIERRGVGG